MSKIIEKSVVIYLPNGNVDSYIIGMGGITGITELDGVPGVVIYREKEEMTYCGFPYRYDEVKE